MFPLNLQRNIVQLDRQISLLENECKNMEVEKKKKNSKPEPSYSTCSKISNSRLKPPTVKVSVKKADSSKTCKKPTPPISARLQSTSSVYSSGPKAWSEIGDGSIKKKTKGCAFNSNSCCCKFQCSPQCNSKKENKCAKCVCCNEISVSDLAKDEGFEENQKDYVLHKELLFPNTGGAIEVTVTQKPSNGKENSPVNQKLLSRKSLNSETFQKDLDSCKCQIKGQKWSEILCGDSPKRKDPVSGGKNKILSDETKIIHQPSNILNNKKPEDNLSCGCHNNSNKEESFEIPVKLSSQPCKATRQSEINSNKIEKETQPCENCCNEPAKELKDPVKIFRFLVNQFQQMPSEDFNKLPTDNETGSNSAPDRDTNKIIDFNQNNAAFLTAVKHHCENLMKEKALLSQQLVAKDNAITVMRKREEEYLSLINQLKSSLEKAKETAQEGADAVKEMNVIKSKFLQQIKLSEALQKSHVRLQKILEQCSLENDKLKTEIKISKLETQKNEVLLAGKEAEISRYKEEIINFQRQISDHLASLKSNAQEINVEKMIEAIVQQSQIFAQSEMNLVLEKDRRDSSKLQNVLIHSSPTSTKTSVVNSSWKQISSIHEHDLSKADSDAVIYLNDEVNEKNFFEIFGEKTFTDLASPKRSKEFSVEKLLDKNEVKRSSSFTSCLSANDEHNSNKNSLTSKESLIFGEVKSDEQSRKTSAVSSEKAENNIDELLKNMKLKFAKEIFENSLPSYTTEDFLDISQISSISPL